MDCETIAQQKVLLAQLRSQVAELELRLGAQQHQDAGGAEAPGAPAVPNVRSQPPFEHVHYQRYRGNIGPQGLGGQRPVDPTALSTE